MRRAERWAEYRSAVQGTRERVDGRHLYHLVFREVGKNGNGRASEQSLSRAWRAIQGDVVPSCCSDDEPALCARLAADFIERFVIMLVRARRATYERFLRIGFSQKFNRIRQRSNGMNAKLRDERCLVCIFFWHVEVGESRIARGRGDGEAAEHAADAAVERKFSCE